MAKFLVLYNSSLPSAEMMAGSTPEQMQAGMAAWMEWAGKWDSAIVDMGSPVGSGRRVSADSAAPSTTQVTGYSIVEAPSADAAVEIFTDHPHFQTPADTSIDVLELMPVPGS